MEFGYILITELHIFYLISGKVRKLKALDRRRRIAIDQQCQNVTYLKEKSL